MFLIGRQQQETTEITASNDWRRAFSNMVKIHLHSRTIFLFLYVCTICVMTIYLSRIKLIDRTEDEGHFWVFTDSHVDDAYRIDGDPKTYCHTKLSSNTTAYARQFGHSHCNPPKELLVSALSAARRIDSSIDFIIWMGDATSHQFGQKDTIIPTNNHLTEQLRKSFPETLIIPVLGNHDVVLTADRAKRFEEFYHQTNYSLLLQDEQARRTFLRGGYYSLRYRSKQRKNGPYLRFIAMNTGMFEPRHAQYFDPEQVLEQIDWFNQTMADAFHRNDPVLLLFHTPFGINENLLYRYYPLLYEQRLLSIIDRYSSQIIMCLTGHRHQDTIRLYSTATTTLGILSHPAITPISSLTNPAIRRYTYNRTLFRLIDYDQYTLSLIETEQTRKDQWKLAYRFSSWYHQSKELTSESLFRLIYLIRTQPFYLKRFLVLKHSAEDVMITRQRLIQTVCALTLFNFDDLILCTRSLQRQTSDYHPMVLNHSSEINIHQKEQTLQYRRAYRRVALCLFSALLVLSWLIYQILRKSSVKIPERRE